MYHCSSFITRIVQSTGPRDRNPPPSSPAALAAAPDGRGVVEIRPQAGPLSRKLAHVDPGQLDVPMLHDVDEQRLRRHVGPRDAKLVASSSESYQSGLSS